MTDMKITHDTDTSPPRIAALSEYAGFESCWKLFRCCWSLRQCRDEWLWTGRLWHRYFCKSKAMFSPLCPGRGMVLCTDVPTKDDVGCVGPK